MTQTEAQQIKDLLEQRMAGIQQDLDEIKEQTKQTNGRVKDLELIQERQKGSLMVISRILMFFVPVISGVMLWVLVEKVFA